MAYEPSAAASIHAAETSSPRDSASTAQPAAPTIATRVQITTDLGDSLRRAGSGAAPACSVSAVGLGSAMAIRPLARSSLS
ncbi:hypothetical protein GCM10010329_00980 [Streptomyces spiroverticillatus]|nr:hypothetical protein GCM10010329_00980 [Streptomyces spiroverticillatus]